MRLHLLGLFHTLTHPDYSHCAFTGRVLRFGRMMLPFGHEVIEYSNEGSVSQASEHVVILSRDEFEPLRARLRAAPPHGEATLDSDIYRAFSAKLKPELLNRVRPGDIVCHPFGHTHADLGELLPQAYHVEIGVGYPHCHFPMRVYETYQWWSWHQGKEQRPGGAYEWVCPMAYDIDEWQPQAAMGDYLLYFGRIVECKGLAVVREIARRVDMPVIICGAGDPSPWLSPDIPNLTYRPPVTGRARSDLLGGARAMLMPTAYTEPFGGAGVEGMLCGTPLLASDHGAFSETVIHGLTGYRCKTLGDWLIAIERLPWLNRRAIAEHARATYSLEACGRQMDRIVRQIGGLGGEGWYSLTPTNAIWCRDAMLVPSLSE